MTETGSGMMTTRDGDIGGTGAGRGGRSRDAIDHDPSLGPVTGTGDIGAEVVVEDVTIIVIEVGDLRGEIGTEVRDLDIAEILRAVTPKTGEQVLETTPS